MAVKLRSLTPSRGGLMWCLPVRWFWRAEAPPPQPTRSPHSLHTARRRSRGRPAGSGSNPKKCHGLPCVAAPPAAFGLLSSLSLGDGKETAEEEEGKAEPVAAVVVAPDSLAVSGLDIVVTSLMTSMGLGDWLRSDHREELLGSARVTSWMSCRRRRTVARHLPSAHFAHVRPEHDALLQVTLGVHLHLPLLLVAGRSGQEQARGQGQRRPGGGAAPAAAASPPRLPGRQHGIRDVVCVGGRLKERDILEELVVV
ncbi:hypothetical protein EYF80_043325 [Liparis tanakae]|uniref:Uncharacterized protein n=1 Tax=Liparis tanakae TaxID=230148 RepID=A0A4Z2FZ28_9TELE|nr:hypothetical protein EYF80_043325 [Liparis tanakae]